MRTRSSYCLNQVTSDEENYKPASISLSYCIELSPAGSPFLERVTGGGGGGGDDDTF